MMGSVLPGSVVNLVELWTLSECEANLCDEELLELMKKALILQLKYVKRRPAVRWVGYSEI